MSTPAPPTKHPDRDTTRPLRVRIFLHREDGHWSAVAPEYTITGMGASPEAAMADVQASLDDYLAWCRSEGLSAEEARRPVPARWRLEMEAKVRAANLVRRLLHRQSAEQREISLGGPLHCLP